METHRGVPAPHMGTGVRCHHASHPSPTVMVTVLAPSHILVAVRGSSRFSFPSPKLSRHHSHNHSSLQPDTDLAAKQRPLSVRSLTPMGAGSPQRAEPEKPAAGSQPEHTSKPLRSTALLTHTRHPAGGASTLQGPHHGEASGSTARGTMEGILLPHPRGHHPGTPVPHSPPLLTLCFLLQPLAEPPQPSTPPIGAQQGPSGTPQPQGRVSQPWS